MPGTQAGDEAFMGLEHAEVLDARRRGIDAGQEFFIQLGRRYDCRIVVRAALIFAISSGVAGFTSGW